MGAKIGGDDDEPIAEINIVPFVDIILVVLIIFMVTTPIIMNPSINVNLPQASSGDESSNSTQLMITVLKDGSYALNGQPSTADAIKEFAQGTVSKLPFIQAIITADKDVAHGQVISIIDIIKSVGVKKFAISVERKK